ncbi:hypothetical protein JKP88DRAFT_255141 [Tribonema minus]|uniref:Uncharacterized protein n=1 Tax=Tribonema minus TaxID=303371 RepID=A0A835Z0J4_9STRA|nr:hypothetical protein JKP88DRAFT_255141 [Tribonema minus]
MSLALSTATVTNVNIYGQSTGTIGITTVSGGTGPYTIAWTSSSGATPITTQTADAKTLLKAGTYRITVTDSVAATTFRDYVVAQNPALVIAPGSVHIEAKHGEYRANISASTVTGGNGTYTISWTSTGTAISDTTAGAKTGLRHGKYTLHVADGAGATASHVFTVPVKRRMYHSPDGHDTRK